jgi:hypothetical protein
VACAESAPEARQKGDDQIAKWSILNSFVPQKPLNFRPAVHTRRSVMDKLSGWIDANNRFVLILLAFTCAIGGMILLAAMRF